MKGTPGVFLQGQADLALDLFPFERNVKPVLQIQIFHRLAVGEQGIDLAVRSGPAARRWCARPVPGQTRSPAPSRPAIPPAEISTWGRTIGLVSVYSVMNWLIRLTKKPRPMNSEPPMRHEQNQRDNAAGKKTAAPLRRRLGGAQNGREVGSGWHEILPESKKRKRPFGERIVLRFPRGDSRFRAWITSAGAASRPFLLFAGVDCALVVSMADLANKRCPSCEKGPRTGGWCNAPIAGCRSSPTGNRRLR